MKEIIEKEVRTVDVTKYKCETCGELYESKSYINKCIICGKEFCCMCEPKSSSLYIISDELLNTKYLDGINFLEGLGAYGYERVYCCSECKSRLMKERQYDAKFEKIIKNFKKELIKLNKEVHKG